MAARAHDGIELATLLPGNQLAEAAGSVLIRGLRLDSRQVAAGDLFLAVKGWQQDGRDFIHQAVARGCAAVVAEAVDFDRICPPQGTVVKSLEHAGTPLILIPDLQNHVSAIAAGYYGHPGQAMDILGITGTNGKTTCASLIAQLASLLGDTAGLIGTLGWGTVAHGTAALTDTGMTTPDAVSLQDILFQLRAAGVSILAMEVSSHSLDQGRVAAAGIDCAIYTNLSRDHLDYHGSEEHYAAAKARLFALPSVKQAIVNIDDAFGASIFAALPSTMDAVSYGLSPGADVRATDMVLTDQGLAFRIHSPWGTGLVNSRLLGGFNALNLLAVIAAFCLRGVTLDKVLTLVPMLQPVPGRMEMLARVHCPRVVVDYAHTPDALEKALQSLRQHCQGRLWCVFGCGGDRDQGKRPQMGAIAEALADEVVVTSDNPRREAADTIIGDILGGMARPQLVRVISDRQAAIAAAIADAAEGDCILLAGKGHESYQQIGAEKRPFSDVEEANKALDKRTGGREGGKP